MPIGPTTYFGKERVFVDREACIQAFRENIQKSGTQEYNILFYHGIAGIGIFKKYADYFNTYEKQAWFLLGYIDSLLNKKIKDFEAGQYYIKPLGNYDIFDFNTIKKNCHLISYYNSKNLIDKLTYAEIDDKLSYLETYTTNYDSTFSTDEAKKYFEIGQNCHLEL